MKTIFCYNTKMSFGLGAYHLSVEMSADGKKIKIFEGTPQQPKFIKSWDAMEELIKEVMETKENMEGAECLRRLFNLV